jgi:transcriptional regulator with XRE-family HTH domain
MQCYCPLGALLLAMRETQEWIAQAINAERAARGMTIKALATASGVPERSLIRVLKCERDLNVAQLAKLAAALGVLPSYLQLEAERRYARATPEARAAAIIQSDETLTSRQKNALLGESITGPSEVPSQADDDRGGATHHPE